MLLFVWLIFTRIMLYKHSTEHLEKRTGKDQKFPRPNQAVLYQSPPAGVREGTHSAVLSLLKSGSFHAALGW